MRVPADQPHDGRQTQQEALLEKPIDTYDRRNEAASQFVDERTNTGHETVTLALGMGAFAPCTQQSSGSRGNDGDRNE